MMQIKQTHAAREEEPDRARHRHRRQREAERPRDRVLHPHDRGARDQRPYVDREVEVVEERLLLGLVVGVGLVELVGAEGGHIGLDAALFVMRLGVEMEGGALFVCVLYVCVCMCFRVSCARSAPALDTLESRRV